MSQFILHVSGVADSSDGKKVVVTFTALEPIPTPPAPAAGQPVQPARVTGRYPGFQPIGNLQLNLAPADAVAFTRGAEFSLVPKS